MLIDVAKPKQQPNPIPTLGSLVTVKSPSKLVSQRNENGVGITNWAFCFK